MPNFISHKSHALTKAYNYSNYKALIVELWQQGKLTGGEATEEMLKYTKLNIARLNRVEKTVTISADLQAAIQNYPKFELIVITEGWCGDAAQIAGLFQKIADVVNTRCHYVLRDENLPLMDLFLTNGTSRSIPICICVDAGTGDYLWHWGPRPKQAQNLLDELKAKNVPLETQKIELHKWYANDKLATTQAELLQKFTQLAI